MLIKIQNKNGQVGDTLTWVVATLIIIFILLVSIFSIKIFSIFTLGKTKNNLDPDPIIQKSVFSFLLSKSVNGQTFFEKIRNEENLDSESDGLLNKILGESIKGRYSFFTTALFGYKMKFFLGILEDELRDGSSYYGMDQPVYISENKFIDLVFYFAK